MLNSLKLEDPVSLNFQSLGAKLIPKRDVLLGWRFCGVLQYTSLYGIFLSLVGDLVSTNLFCD